MKIELNDRTAIIPMQEYETMKSLLKKQKDVITKLRSGKPVVILKDRQYSAQMRDSLNRGDRWSDYYHIPELVFENIDEATKKAFVDAEDTLRSRIDLFESKRNNSDTPPRKTDLKWWQIG